MKPASAIEPFISEEATSKKPFSGLHIVANLKSRSGIALTSPEGLKKFLDALIVDYRLQCVGEVYHSFPEGGYTAIIALTESHLSIHTWPEHGYVTFDVFISNYLKDNRETTMRLYQDIKSYFNASVLAEQFIER